MKKNNKSMIALLSIATLLSANSMHADGWLDSLMGGLFGNSKPTNTTYTNSYSNNNSSSYNGYTLSESQAKSYIDQIIASVDYSLRPHINDSAQLNYLKNLIKKNVSTPQVYKYTPHGKRYKKDLIDQYISSAILQYIEEKSYSYAYNKSSNRTISRKIATSMRNNALAVISQNGAINLEAITKFVGRSLQKAIDEALNRFDAPYQTGNYYSAPAYVEPSAPPAYSYPSPYESPAPAYSPSSYQSPPPAYSSSYAKDSDLPSYESVVNEKNYPSQECCVCFEDLNASNRLFLRPCGHDMCKTCAYTWFFGSTQDKTCPQCRGIVDLDRLGNDIG